MPRLETMAHRKSYRRGFVAHRLYPTKLESLVPQKVGKMTTWVSPMRIGGYNNLTGPELRNPAKMPFSGCPGPT